MFKEFYYWIYQDLKNGVTKIPFFNACIGLSFLECLNVMSLLAFINYFVDYRIPQEIVFLISIGVLIPILGLNFVVMYNNREEIIVSIDELGEKRKKMGKYFLWAYIAFTVLTLYLVLENFVAFRG